MDKKVVFVHGYTASSRENWYPNISRELDKLGVGYSIRDYPGDRDPQKDEWLQIIEEEVRATEKSIVLIGHSLGTRAILLYLEKSRRKVDTVILIAPPGNIIGKWKRYDEGRVADFFEQKIDLEKLRERANKFIVVHSRDDSDVPYEEGVEIAEGLGAELVTLDGRGHMSEPENYAYVLEVLQKVL